MNSQEIAKELHVINENLKEQNRLIAEVLKYLLRNEGRNESAKK